MTKIGAVAKKYQSIPETSKKGMDIGDLGETLDAISELQGSFKWIYRFPSLFITVAIACGCIPISIGIGFIVFEI